jgi:hypothetical protein
MSTIIIISCIHIIITLFFLLTQINFKLLTSEFILKRKKKKVCTKYLYNKKEENKQTIVNTQKKEREIVDYLTDKRNILI